MPTDPLYYSQNKDKWKAEAPHRLSGIPATFQFTGAMISCITLSPAVDKHQTLSTLREN